MSMYLSVRSMPSKTLHAHIRVHNNIFLFIKEKSLSKLFLLAKDRTKSLIAVEL